MSNRQKKLKSLFMSVLEIDSPNEREAYLNRHCAGDARLRAELMELLAHEQELYSFLDPPDGESLATFGSPVIAQDLEVIGPYRIREKLGEGGMGTVYVAEQTEPVRRKVALKIIKPGMDSKQVIARFEAERQALAMMSHPNIAKVLDGGTTDCGRPYFVMELVKGIPITEFCDQQKLGTRERLALFNTVCQAVQHAHQKGIIHRDLKPSNVMVELYDVEPVPKVIDFGVAKATNQQLTEHTIYTQFSQLIGTPMYMSPEQAQLSALDVDTRSDIYSLGVLLYELLTGSTPFERKELSRAGLDEMRRIIREVDPLRPSHKVNTLSDELASTVSDLRQSDARSLALSMKRELDWIVMKAMEKDRTRRYETASALADDIRRYLDDEPVEACPPSVAYRTRKYARRHKTLLTTIGLVLLTMLAGMGVSAWYAVDAHSARLVADAESTRAREHAHHTRQLLYAGDLRLAGYAVRRNDVARMRELLALHIPAEGEADLRGFEWYFLWKQVEMRPRELLQANGALYFVCFSPGNQLLAAAGKDGVIRVLDAEDFELLASIDSGQVEVNGLAFSPDSKKLASSGDDGSICLWDIADRHLLQRIAAHDSLAYQVAFTPDGELLASCGDDTEIRFWEVETGRPLETLGHHKSKVECLAIASNGLLASGSADETTVIIDLTTSEQKSPFPFHPQHARWVRGILNWDKGPVTCVAFSQDASILAHGQKGGLLTLYDTNGQGVISRQVFPDGLQSVGFSPKTGAGYSLAVGDRGGNVHVLPVDWAHGASGVIVSHGQSTQLRQWRAHDGRVYSLAFHPDGKRLITAGEYGRLLLWNVDAPNTRRTIADYHQSTLIDDSHFVSAASDLTVRNLADGQVTKTLASTDEAWSQVHVANATGEVYAEAATGDIFAWNRNGSPRGRIWRAPPLHEVGSTAVSSDGRRLAVEVVEPNGGTFLEVFDVDARVAARRIACGQVHAVAFSPDSRHLAFDTLNSIRVADFKSGGGVRVLAGHRLTIRDIEFSPDGRFLASVSDDRLLKVWDIEKGEEDWSVVAHENEVSTLAFSPDGRTIATAGNEGLLRLWRWKVGRLVLEIPLSNPPVNQLEFSPGGYRILASESNCLTLYDASVAAIEE